LERKTRPAWTCARWIAFIRGKDEPEFETAEKLYIHPDECIDCGACVPACPVEAIFVLDEVPDKWKNFIEIDANYYKK
jgi:ferredoxin